MKAGMSARSAKLSQRNLTISESAPDPSLRRAQPDGRRKSGVMHDVGVGEQQIIRRLRQRRRLLDALLHGPELAGPPGRQGSAGHDIGAALLRSLRGAGHSGGAVAAVVIDQDDRPTARIVLLQKEPMLSAMLSASLRAGTTAATRGHVAGGAGFQSSRSVQRQKAPRAVRR